MVQCKFCWFQGILFCSSLNRGDRCNGLRWPEWRGWSGWPMDRLLALFFVQLSPFKQFLLPMDRHGQRCAGHIQMIVRKRPLCFHMYWDQLPKASPDPRHQLVQWPCSIIHILCHSPGSCRSYTLEPFYHMLQKPWTTRYLSFLKIGMPRNTPNKKTTNLSPNWGRLIFLAFPIWRQLVEVPSTYYTQGWF